eukprot:tig00000144_g9121.t1
MEGHADFGSVDVDDRQVHIRQIIISIRGRPWMPLRIDLHPASSDFRVLVGGSAHHKAARIPDGGLQTTVVAKTPLRLQIMFRHAGQLGVSRQAIVLQFGVAPPDVLAVTRKCFAAVVRVADQAALNAEAPPFYPQHLRRLFDGAAPPALLHVASAPPLPSYASRESYPGLYPVPDALLAPPDELAKLPPLAADAGPLGYLEHFHKALFIEEVQMLHDIKAYDLFHVALAPAGRDSPPTLRRLRVPGLPEKRPDLQYGDLLRVRVADSDQVEYRCFVQAVLAAQAQVLAVVPQAFALRWPPQGPAPRCHVRFTFCRMGLRRMHQALDDVVAAGAVPLFPAVPRSVLVLGPPRPRDLDAAEADAGAGLDGELEAGEAFGDQLDGEAEAGAEVAEDEAAAALHGRDALGVPYDAGHGGPCFPVIRAAFPYGPDAGREEGHSRRRHPRLQPSRELNPEQLEAVARAVLHPPTGAPFLVWGPVGTGKTMTAVEVVVQAARRSPAARVLVVAPSNSAADTICSRLAPHFPKGAMFRLNGFQRPPASVFAAVLPYCVTDAATGIFDVPPLEELAAFRVVLAVLGALATCAGSGILRSLGLPAGHFHWIVYDEAGQALEPEALIPLQNASASTRVVIAGDPRQLGPLVRSPLAGRLGLHVSLQERLLGQGPYARRDPRYLTTLRRNYRSQAALLEVPGRLFYEGRLVAAAERDEALLGWGELAAPVPLLFFSVEGQDVRDVDSPSLHNPIEASAVCELVLKLLAFGSSAAASRLTTDSIGVIAPYRKQVRSLRTLLRSRGLGAIRVGTESDYQGQEERVIIVSTTVARKGRLAQAREQRLGFLRDPRSFNVAVTRAKALLIVVGHAAVLSDDPCWRALIQHAAKLGAYKGAPCEAAAAAAGGAEASVEEVARAAAERLLLGAEEDAFPPLDNLGHFYADADDLEFRVVL